LSSPRSLPTNIAQVPAREWHSTAQVSARRCLLNTLAPQLCRLRVEHRAVLSWPRDHARHHPHRRAAVPSKGKKVGGRLAIIGVDVLKATIFDRLQRGRTIRFSNTFEPSFFEQLASERASFDMSVGSPFAGSRESAPARERRRLTPWSMRSPPRRRSTSRSIGGRLNCEGQRCGGRWRACCRISRQPDDARGSPRWSDRF
jgi:hypothetical protein